MRETPLDWHVWFSSVVTVCELDVRRFLERLLPGDTEYDMRNFLDRFLPGEIEYEVREELREELQLLLTNPMPLDWKG